MRTSRCVASIWCLAFGGAAHAADCVALDPTQDTLAESDQKAAQIVFRQVLEDAGRTVGSDDCGATWGLSHTSLGDTISVRLTGPGAPARLTAGSMDELPAVYERLVRAVLTDTDPHRTEDRNSVTTAEAEPARRAADQIGYALIGGGMVVANGQGMSGITIIPGHRFELDRVAIETSGRLFFPTADGSQSSGAAAVLLGARVAAIGFTDAQAPTSFYAGGGVGLGGGGVAGGAQGGSTSSGDDGAGDEAGFGLNVEGIAGMAFLRTSRIRMFAQVDVSLPTWTANGTWLPLATLSVGVGGEPKNALRARR